MPTTDWYRRTTWTEVDQSEFAAKLKRARDKPQYLRIQALHLSEAGLYSAAIDLLHQIVKEFPDASQITQSHLQLAHAYAKTDKPDLALQQFKLTLELQRKYPNWQTSVWLDYPVYVIENKIASEYVNARSVLLELNLSRSLSFPIERYRYFACLALLDENDGKLDSARQNASHAMAACDEKHSGFRYHPTVGLVGQQRDALFSRLLHLNSK
ncbi:MAG: hypothetical protein WCI02_15035 [Planctomycetota bacterium]